MDINKFLNEGVTVKNPNYKKPTKRDPSGSPRFIQSGEYNDAVDRSSRIGTMLSQDSYDLTYLENDKNKYADYGVRINPVNTQEELNQSRAKNQSAWEQTGRSLGQMVGNEVILGTALGLSNLVDAAVNLGKESGTNDYTNPFSKFLEDKQTEVRSAFEIYQENPNDSWQVGDFGWWANNAVSVASSLSMMIPSMAVTKGLSTIGKALKLEKVSRGIAKAAKAGGLTKGPTTLANAINSGAEIGTAAFLSRTMEGYLEARGVYNEVYDKTLDRVSSMSDEDKGKLFANNPELVGKNNEEIASFISGKSADETFKNDYAMLLFDIAQFKALGSMWKGVANKAVNGNIRTAQRNALGNLVNETSNDIPKLGFLAKRREAIQHAVNNPMSSLSAIQLSEGIEEGYQGIQTEKGKEVAEKMLDPNFSNRNLESYLADGHIWEQAFWGVLGGVGFQVAGTALGNLSKAVKGKYDKATLTEQEYALTQMTDEKAREDEINSRQGRMQKYADSMQLLNANKNPFGYRIDPDTQQPIIEEGSRVNEDIDPEEANRLKTKLTNDLVTNMTLDAVDKGNYDLLKDFVSDNNFDKFFKDAGLNLDSGDKSFSNMLLNKMDDVAEKYNSALYDILNSVDVENENVAKLVARDISRRKLEVEDLYNISGELEVDIANNSDNNDYSAYEEAEKVKYVDNILKDIDNKEVEVNNLLANKRISPQAAEQIKKDNNIRRNQLLAFASTNNFFGNPDVVKDILNNSIGNADTSKFLAEFNNFMSNAGNGLFDNTGSNANTAPKKSLQDLIKKKIVLDDNVDYLEQTLPNTQSAYQQEYDDMAMGVDRLTVERYSKAADIVGEYLESQSNLDEARDNIMTNNVPDDIKKQLDILKLGHHTTKAYTSQINAILGELEKDRVAAEREARNVNVDGQVSNTPNAQKAKEDVDEVSSETDSRQPVIDSSSTGEPQQSVPEVAPNNVQDEQTTTFINAIDPNEIVVNVEEDIAVLDKSADDIEAQRVQDFILDNDSRAVGLASSITFNLFKTDRQMFNNLEGKDVNSSEFNGIIDIVADELETQGVTRGPFARKAALDGVKLALNTIYRRLNSKGVDGADTFKRLADEIATKHKVEVGNEDKASTTSLIPDNEFNQVIDQFINSYVENKGIYTVRGSKTIINVEDLFKELLNNESISFEQAKHIFFNIADYIRAANNSKYIFTNKTELNKNLKTPTAFFNNLINSKTTVEVVDNYMHIAAPSKLPEGYNKAINDAVAGGNVAISYYEKDGNTSTNSISIKSNGVEIGYLATVNPNNTNTGFSLKKQTRGFVYNLNDNNGIIESNLDKFFVPLINRQDAIYSNLMDIAYKQFVFETAFKNNNISAPISNEDAVMVVTNPVIKSLISNSDIIIPTNKVTKLEQAQYILNAINNIVFHGAGLSPNSAAVERYMSVITKPLMLESYSYWKSSNFNNYANTHRIQTALSKTKKVNTKLVNVGVGKVLYDAVNHDVDTRGFSYERNPIMIVDANGNIINESTNTAYANPAGFEAGTMGMLVGDNPNGPAIAFFTETNKLSISPDLANDVYREITNLLNDFQNKTISFDSIAASLGDLFSGPYISNNNLFSGYSVVKTNDKIGLNIQGVVGEYSLIIHKFEKGTNKEGTGITYIPNGDKTKASSSVAPNKKFNNAVAKEIVSNLSFNKTFYAVNNKNVDNDKSNKYLYKENGKLVINIGGVSNTYNNFSHFVLRNNAFKTNQGLNSSGGYFNTADKIKSLYIDTAIINSPVEETSGSVQTSSVSDTIKNASKTKGFNTSEVLVASGVAKDRVDVLTGSNQFGIELIPKEAYFDNKATKAEAYYSKGKMYFTTKGANAIGKSPSNLIRLLIHENLHAKFDEQGLFQREGIVDDLMSTYNAFVNDLNNVGQEDSRYKDASAIKDWLERNKFNPTDYISTLSVQQQRSWDNATQEERDRLFAEEWLVESLSQPAIIRYLNSAIYTGGDVSVEGIDNSTKTIWQKIVDVLLKLFGKGTGNIKNNTILAQQYYVLGDRNTTNTELENIVKRNEDVNVPGETPVDTPTSEVEQIDDTPAPEVIKPKRERRERFAITSNIENADSIDNVIINTHRDTPNINMNGVQTIADMNKYVDQFAEQDKPLIAKMIAANELKFACE